MAIIVLIIFWSCVALTAINISWKPALVFAALWFVGFNLFSMLELNAYLFVSFQAILALPMAIWLKAKVF